MKSKVDFCRIQWLNREFSSVNYMFQWNKSESRFAMIFDSIIEEDKLSKSNDKPLTFKKLDRTPSYPIIQSQNNRSLYNDQNKKELSKTNQPYRSSEINIIKILTQEDKRTTIMIRNIPNKFTKDNFLDIFNIKFKGQFDLFLLPTDINEKKNFGYAFINFINYFYIVYFYHLFNGKKWANTNSVKICEIVYSKIQGIAKMTRHFPIKVMYQKEIRDKFSEYSKREKQDNDDVNSISIAIPIPLVYRRDFEKIYPNVDIEADINDKDVFYVLPQKLLYNNQSNN